MIMIKFGHANFRGLSQDEKLKMADNAVKDRAVRESAIADSNINLLIKAIAFCVGGKENFGETVQRSIDVRMRCLSSMSPDEADCD